MKNYPDGDFCATCGIPHCKFDYLCNFTALPSKGGKCGDCLSKSNNNKNITK